MIKPVSTPDDLNIRKVYLGKDLFRDASLSRDGTISCASCHPSDMFGVDNFTRSVGVDGKTGDINTPTTYHSRYFFAQFQDGRAKDLQEQALGPITNPVEMDNTIENVLKYVKSNNHYIVQFRNLYNDGITIENIVDAIAEFEKALVSPSRFDEYLKTGDKSVMRDVELEGFELFKSYGCIACHNGISLGGNLFQKLGIFKPYEGTSLGRFNVTGEEQDKYYYKVSTLRNIYWTHPYLHDGSIEKTYDVIEFMGEYQLGVDIPDEDIKKIEQFFHSLTGELPNVVK
ncbi:cytochrome B6 [Arcobacter sp. FWKO B]|nr:cytochrome B6 [Arcobacter sp. FWKO B]